MSPRHLFGHIARRVQSVRRRFDPHVQIVAAAAQRWDDAGGISDTDMIFIGACPRSGTTMLREMLGRHPRLATGPEGGFFHRRPEIDRLAVQWSMPEADVAAILQAAPDLPAFVDAMAMLLMERSGKQRYVEKTPVNVRFVPQILDFFPRGRFIHIIRDGRDAVCSLRGFGGSELRGGKLVKIPPVPGPIGPTAEFWAKEVSMGLATRNHPRCLEVRYEQLVAEPERELRRICAFIGEDYDPVMLLPTPEGAIAPTLWSANAGAAPDQSRVGRWQAELDAADRRAVAHVAGALLVALGYANDDGWVGGE